AQDRTGGDCGAHLLPLPEGPGALAAVERRRTDRPLRAAEHRRDPARAEPGSHRRRRLRRGLSAAARGDDLLVEFWTAKRPPTPAQFSPRRRRTHRHRMPALSRLPAPRREPLLRLEALLVAHLG